MIFYRLDTLSGAEGARIASNQISATDDVEAVRLARSLADGQPMELWCGTRKVKSFPSVEPETA